MLLTQEEARLWGEILIGFSQGKEYVYPHTYDKDFNVVGWVDLTDFTVNKDTPTIQLTGISPLSLLDPRFVKEKK